MVAVDVVGANEGGEELGAEETLPAREVSLAGLVRVSDVVALHGFGGDVVAGVDEDGVAGDAVDLCLRDGFGALLLDGERGGEKSGHGSNVADGQAACLSGGAGMTRSIAKAPMDVGAFGRQPGSGVMRVGHVLERIVEVGSGGGSVHDLLEGGLELGHLVCRTDGDADGVGPDGPCATDEDVVGLHGLDDLSTGALGVDHEAVGLRSWEDGVVVLGEPIDGVDADVADDLLAGGDEFGVEQADVGGDGAGDGHGVLTKGLQLGKEIRAADGVSAADAGHAVDLREGTDDDEVLARGDLVDDGGASERWM